MSNYLRNLKLWLLGWGRFDELEFKPGWSATSWKWKLLYGTDYLACCLIFAGPVVSISRYWFDFWGVRGRHFANAGEPLWGSVRSAPWLRVLAPAVTLVLLWSIL